MPYLDGFVTPVPKRNLAKYKAMGRKWGRIWRDHGALSYTETIADDVKPGKVTSFPQAVKLKPGEVVCSRSSGIGTAGTETASTRTR
jgi:uncharacterized protein YbaA (DUF1428 family)